MSELTYTEKKIQRKVKWLPPFLRPFATKMFVEHYKNYKHDIWNEKNTDEVKIPYPPLLVIDAQDSKENEQKRQIAKDILYTQYNAEYDKILHDYFIHNKSNAIHKWYMYFDAYERHFSRFRGKDVNILEIGVQNGGSARMWKHYFTHGYPNAKVNIYGVDIDPRCKDFEEDGIQIFIGSQEDKKFWRDLKRKIPKVDILIDDGGHTMKQQIVTFEEMYDFVKDDGVYLCEDLHTSYWKSYGGYNAIPTNGGGGGIATIPLLSTILKAS